jgi:hypothetical protein
MGAGASVPNEKVKLSYLGPSVNSLAVRIFVRYAGIPFEEDMVR